MYFHKVDQVYIIIYEKRIVSCTLEKKKMIQMVYRGTFFIKTFDNHILHRGVEKQKLLWEKSIFEICITNEV